MPRGSAEGGGGVDSTILGRHLVAEEREGSNEQAGRRRSFRNRHFFVHKEAARVEMLRVRIH